MARYGQAFKDRAVARLLPPESAAVEVVAREVGVERATLERWREDALAKPARGRVWTAAARLEAVITTAAHERGRQERLVPRARRVSGRAGQVARQLHHRAGRARGSARQPAGHAADRKRIKELERELLRKDRALAETAALLVLSKKVAAIFNKGEDE